MTIDQPQQAYLELIQKLLTTEVERLQGQGSPQMIFAVLQRHRAALNLGLIPVMQQFTRRYIAENPQEADSIIALIENISIHISNFPLGNPRQNQQIAIAGYRLVLETRSEQQTPEPWAQTQNNLGNAYSRLAPFSENPKAAIEFAIGCYQAALRVYSETELPQDWSMTQNNLGNAYSRLAPFSENPKAAIESAIGCYQAALRVRTPEMRPVDCLQTGRNLGDMAFKDGNWTLALEGYGVAIQAVEQTRTWATDDDRRQELIANAIGVYANALQCHINLQQYDQAILLTERARSRHLVDLMHSNDLYKNGDIPAEVQHYLDEYETLQRRIDQLRQQDGDGTPDHLASTLRSSRLDSSPEQLAERKQQINALVEQKQAVWKQLRSLDRVLADGLEVPQLDIEKLQSLIDNRPHTALLSFYSVQDHTYVLVLRHSLPSSPQPPSPRTGEGGVGTGEGGVGTGEGGVGTGEGGVGTGEKGTITCQVHTCTDEGVPFQNWILKHWLTPYQTDFSSWRDQMGDRLTELAQRLDLDTLIQDHLQGIDDLILIPHLALHLIPFAALPVGKNEERGRRNEEPTQSPNQNPKSKIQNPPLFGDKFRLRILPSAQILSYCHDRQSGHDMAPTVVGRGMVSVEDASGDRPVVTAGFEAIAQRLAIPPEKRLRGKQQATTANYRTYAKADTTRAIHSIHHASSNLGTPLESALQLADGNITLGQLLSPGWRMPHLIDVFLSCCETNLGNPNLTDDILTLSTGFLCAGARSVVSTLWSVDALATALFCDFYYEFREMGSDRPTALQQAQQKMQTFSNTDLNNRLASVLEAEFNRLEDLIYDVGKTIRTAQKSGQSTTHLEAEQKQYQAQSNQICQAQARLHALCKEPYPFTSPFYWAGFVSQGLR